MVARAQHPGRRMRLSGMLPPDTLHVVIDMQRLFVEHSEWSVPDLPKIVPPILKLIEAHPRQAVFTRFMTPRNPDEAHRQWHKVTLAEMNPALLELVEPFVKHAQPDAILDKPSHGGFESPAFVEALA